MLGLSFLTLSPMAIVGVIGLIALVLSIGGSMVVFGVIPWETQSEIVRQLATWRVLDFAGGKLVNVVAKTADYTIIAGTTTDGSGDPSGTVFTNRGATGAVIFTLPVITLTMKGLVYEFLGAADQTFTIASNPVDTLTVVNDATADSLAVSTSSHKIGAHMRVLCDGTAWFAYGDSVGDTFTVAT